MTTPTAYRPKVYITRQLPQKSLDLLLGRCNVSFWDSADPAPRTELLVNIPGIDVLVCMPTDKIDREILNAAGPSLKIVATMSDDTGHIECAECTRRNIRIVTIPSGPIVEALTQMIVAVMRLTAVRWIGTSSGNVNTFLQAKDVIEAAKEDKNFCLDLSNRIVGIIGLGKLGLSVGKAFRELGVASILYHDVEPTDTDAVIDAEYVDKNTLLTRSDIICVCWNMNVNGTSTVWFDKESFRRMKSSVILIDATKRFPADFSELYEALRTGEITAAGLDVREYDVIPNRHPLAVLDNCFFLPFRECYKWDGRRRLSVDLVRSILSTLQEIEFEKQLGMCKDKPEALESVFRTSLPT